MGVVQPVLHGPARGFERGSVGVARHADGIAQHHGAAAEGFSEAGPVPGREIETPARHDRDRVDGPARQPGQRHDPEPRPPGHLGHVGRHHDRFARGQHACHVEQGRGAAASAGTRGRSPRPPDRAHAETAQQDRVDLPVAVPGNQRRHAGVSRPGVMDHEVLPVPHGGDHGKLARDRVEETGRLLDEAIGGAHQPEIGAGEAPGRFLHRTRPAEPLQHAPGHAFGCSPFAAAAAGSSSRCRWTMK